jgi:MFS family permease
MSSNNKEPQTPGVQDHQAQSSVVAALLPIMAAVFVAFLVTGLALPVLPLHIHQGLGLGAFVVGLAAGAQFAAALLSRCWAGQYSDSRGGKRAVVAGLLIAIAAGLLYLLSLRFATPTTSATVLLVGRAVLGAAESFIITGALSWGLAVGGPANAGKVMAWVGTAMYVAFAVGAPAGTALYACFGFTAIALATTLLPLVTLLLVLPRQATFPAAQVRPAFARVLAAVWLPGVGLALSSAGFGAITTFSVLLFAQRGWGYGWLALTVFATAFVVARLFLGHLPDRLGGSRVALASVLLEAAGLAVVWLAPSSVLALSGAALAGFGYSLVYPGFGVEAVRGAPAESRGLAMGLYTAFLDLALGCATPALGLVAERAGLPAVFLVSTLVVLCAAAISVCLLGASRFAGSNSHRATTDTRLLSHRGD